MLEAARNAEARWEWSSGGEEDGDGHAGACVSAVVGRPGTPPELLGTATAETSADRARFTQSSVGYVRNAAVEERSDEGTPDSFMGTACISLSSRVLIRRGQ